MDARLVLQSVRFGTPEAHLVVFMYLFISEKNIAIGGQRLSWSFCTPTAV